MTRDAIQQLLGTPELWGTEKRREIATIWRYCDIELYFFSHKLYMIFTDHDALTRGGDTCDIDPWIIRPGLGRNELETALKADNIEFAVSQPAYDTRQRLIVTSANVEFAFLEERHPEWPDDELGLFSWNHQMNPNHRLQPSGGSGRC
jgi:hypothetical protein